MTTILSQGALAMTRLSNDFQVGDWEAHRQLNQIQRSGHVCHLQPRVMEVLYYLACRAGEVLSKDSIIQDVWAECFVGDESLTYAIRELRKSLEDDVNQPKYIETIPRRGYRLIAPVRDIAREPSDRYRILELIGEGAIGEVFKAEDRLLKRNVALKFLKPALEDDAKARKGLLAEARKGAALDHPAICRIYDAGKLEGRSFISLEYIEGETVEQRLSHASLTLSESLVICRQVAAGLESAHAQGIIHRDLKPGNLMLTKNGELKILDFGLAKKIRFPSAQQGSASEMSISLELAGVTVGTAAYMSPEMIQGVEVDRRTDIWGLGCLLFELLSDRKAFEGARTSEILLKVIETEPDWHLLPSDIPPALTRMIHRCLEKEPGRRLRDAGDVGLEIEEILEQIQARESALKTATSGAVPERQPSTDRAGTRKGTGLKDEDSSLPVSVAGTGRRFRWGIIVMVAATTLLVGSVLWFSTSRHVPRVAATNVIPITTTPVYEAEPTISPDGFAVAFTSRPNPSSAWDIYARPIPEGNTARLTTDPAPDLSPAWSPDGNTIAFIRYLGHEVGRYDLMLMAAPFGGGERRLCSCLLSTVSWHPSSKWIAVLADSPQKGAAPGIFAVSVETGEKRRLTAGVDRRSAFSPKEDSLPCTSSRQFRRIPAFSLFRTLVRRY